MFSFFSQLYYLAYKSLFYLYIDIKSFSKSARFGNIEFLFFKFNKSDCLLNGVDCISRSYNFFINNFFLVYNLLYIIELRNTFKNTSKKACKFKKGVYFCTRFQGEVHLLFSVKVL